MDNILSTRLLLIKDDNNEYVYEPNKMKLTIPEE